MLRTATEEPQTNLAQTIASNLEAVIEPAAVLAVVVAPGELVAPGGLAEPAAQGVREALVALAVQGVPAVQAAPVARVVPAVLVVPENPAVRAALAVLEDLAVQVVPANPAVRAVPEDPGVPVALAVPELELVPVAAEREPDQVAVRLRIKLVTAPRRRGLAHLMVGDLAAVAETTREQVAAEAAIAWEAAE